MRLASDATMGRLFFSQTFMNKLLLSLVCVATTAVATLSHAQGVAPASPSQAAAPAAQTAPAVAPADNGAPAPAKANKKAKKKKAKKKKAKKAKQ